MLVIPLEGEYKKYESNFEPKQDIFQERLHKDRTTAGQPLEFVNTSKQI